MCMPDKVRSSPHHDDAASLKLDEQDVAMDQPDRHDGPCLRQLVRSNLLSTGRVQNRNFPRNGRLKNI